MSVVELHPLRRERFKAGTVVALICSKCGRDIVYATVWPEYVERASRWFGCDCTPERPRLGLSDLAEVVARRIDTARSIAVEPWSGS
jgi:hypothetical protein